MSKDSADKLPAGMRLLEGDVMINELNEADIASVAAGVGGTKPPVLDFWDDFIDIFWDFRSPNEPNNDVW